MVEVEFCWIHRLGFNSSSSDILWLHHLSLCEARFTMCEMEIDNIYLLGFGEDCYMSSTWHSTYP